VRFVLSVPAVPLPEQELVMRSLHAQGVAVLVILAALTAARPADLEAQESKSAANAKEVAALMAARKIDSIAARHPAAPDQFVAALHFPGQLLVVWARYSAPGLLNEKILKGEYRDVYIDLNSASIVESKVLVTDLGADGLQARREENQPFDQQDAGGKGIRFDGNWREDKMSEQEYMKIYAEADAAYTQALGALLTELKKKS
jgi:hypothetical protein